MKKQFGSIFLVSMLLIIAASGCAPASTPPPPTFTSTPIPPTSTPTLTPTLTPTPTSTPTPIPLIGTPVSSADWDVTLLGAVFRERVVATGKAYTSTEGFMVVDLVLKVRNLNPATNPPIIVSNVALAKPDFKVITSEASDVVIVDETGKSWIPFIWGTDPVVEGKEIDPFSVGIYGFEIPLYSFDPDGTMRIQYKLTIENESYLRAIFSIGDTSMGKAIGIKFLDLPAIHFIIEK